MRIKAHNSLLVHLAIEAGAPCVPLCAWRIFSIQCASRFRTQRLVASVSHKKAATTMHSNEDGDVLVVGGASGIGLATSVLFAKEGHKVWIADIDFEAAKRQAEQMEARAIPVDITDIDSVKAMCQGLAREAPKLRSVVIAAGIVGSRKSPHQTPVEDFRRVVDTNLTGPYLCCRELIPLLVRNGGGAVVLFASNGGMMSTPYHAYGPAKSAVINMSMNLAVEWGRSGVRVNCISPGSVDTPMLRANLRAGGGRTLESMVKPTALGRLIFPDEVARVARFLCSSDASAITGANMLVDAGSFAGLSWSGFGGVPPQRDGSALTDGEGI